MKILIGLVSLYYQLGYLVKEIVLSVGLRPGYFVETMNFGKIWLLSICFINQLIISDVFKKTNHLTTEEIDKN